ncbi:MAG: hypothetical protein DI596_12550, partial [Azospira oryzae]
MKPPDEVVEAIVRALELDDAAIARYKAFLEFTDEDVARLKALHAALRGLAPEFAQAFYDHLLGFEETRRFIPDTPTLERLKQTQAAYFDRLTAGDYGRDYIQHRLRVGVAHQRVGLSPHWYLGAYGKYLSGLLPEIWQRLGKDPQAFVATVQALVKIVLLDMGLAIDTYLHADRQTILALKAYAEMVFASVPFGLVVLDADLTILSANRAFLKSMGLAAEAVRGRRFSDVIAADGIEERVLELIAGGQAQHDVLLSMGRAGAAPRKPVRVTLTGIHLAEEEEEEARILVIIEDVTEEERLRAQARAHEQRFHDLVQGLDAIVWEAEAATFAFTFVSQRAEAILGYPVERWLAEPGFWAGILHPQDRERTLALCREATVRGQDHVLEYRAIAADGRVVWLRDAVHVVHDDSGRGERLRGVMVDITERKQAEEWQQHYTQVLDSLIAGVPLRDVLERIAAFAEQQGKGALCSILLASADGRHLTHGAAPSLPEFYNRAVDGLEIGEGAGSCGTAAAIARTVIVEDVMTHPSWAPWRELAERAGLRACWSEPIVSAEGKVLGTFALYYRESRAPTPEEIDLIRRAARLAAIAIERAHAQEVLRLAAVVFEQSVEGIMVTDAAERILMVNRAFVALTGYAPAEVIGRTPRILNSGRHDAAFFRALKESLKT